MCFTITHQILFNFSISNKKQTARGTSLRFLLLCDGFDKTVNSLLRYGKSASKIVFWRKVESVLIFSFHVRKVQNSVSHKHVLGKRSNHRRASFQTFGQSPGTFRQKSQILLVSNTYFDPDFSEGRWVHLSGNLQHSRLEQQNDFSPNPSLFWWFRESRLQHKFLTKPFKVLNNFRCYINIHFITSFGGKIIEQANFPAYAFCFQFSSFFHERAEMS